MMAFNAPHPAGMQPPGMAHGQPMGPGQPHPGPVGPQMGMHAGVSGPGGPHVSQAGPMVAAMQMQPGMSGPGGPNAHAMAHLQANPQMMQQAMAGNPQLQMQYQQQQQMLMQRRLMMQQQQAQQGGMQVYPNAMAQGQNPQLGQIQGGVAGVNLPAHMQQQQALLMQQQQARHAQQMAAQQQHLNMQHAASQGSNQGQPTPSSQPGPQQGQGQAGPPMRPPTAMGGPQNQPSPAQPMNQQQQMPPQSQPPQQPPTSAPQPPTSQAQTGGPPQAAQQAPQAQATPQNQQGQQQAQQQGQQGPQLNQMQQNAMQQRQRASIQMMQAQAQQRQAAQAAQAAAQRQNNPLERLFRFADRLGSFKSDQQQNAIDMWRSFVDDFFVEDASLQLSYLPGTQTGPSSTRRSFEVSAASMPRYFWTHFDGLVDQIQITLNATSEGKFNESYNVARAEKARWVYWFKDGTQAILGGHMQALYRGNKMEMLKFDALEQEQYLPRSKLEELCAQSPEQNRSPRVTKKTNPRNKQPPEPAFDLRKLPIPIVTDYGVPNRTFQFLEFGEIFTLMKDLMYYSQEHPDLTVPTALERLVLSYQQKPTPNMQNLNPQQLAAQQYFMQQNPQIAGAMPPNGAQPPGSRTPNAPMAARPPGMVGPGQGMDQFATMSPAMQNSLLPGVANGSPHIAGNMNLVATHTPSPALAHMAPPMVPQVSQAGSTASGSGVSQNTSPNQSNKRRRSTVQGLKDNGDGGGGEVNGAGAARGGGAQKVKPSPKIGGNKRIKGGQ